MHKKWLRTSVLLSTIIGMVLAMADVSEAGRRRCRKNKRGGCGYSSCQVNYGYSSGCHTHQQHSNQNYPQGEFYEEPAPQPPRMDGGNYNSGPGNVPPSPSDRN